MNSRHKYQPPRLEKDKPRHLPDDMSRDLDTNINIFSHQEDPKRRLGTTHQPGHQQVNDAKLTSKSSILAQVLADKKGEWIHADDDSIVWDLIISNRVDELADRKAIVHLDGSLASECIVREEWWAGDGMKYTAAHIWSGFMAFVHWVENGDITGGT